MPLPASFEGRLALPAIAAPMFLCSGPDLVVETCRSGVVGTFPALNQRTTDGYADWLSEIGERLASADSGDRPEAAPYGVNLIVHRSNARVAADLEATVAHRVPLVITSLGAVREVVDAVHGYGGLVFHDVINLRHAEKAAEAGVDGIIAVCAGAGGHAGTLSPFALVPEIRRMFDGTVVLAGALSTGRHAAAARMIGADLAYFGTRFIATKESLADAAYKQMILEGRATDVVYTPSVSGVAGSFLRRSIEAAGLDPDNMPPPGELEVGQREQRAWKNIWSAGQGLGSISDVPSAAELCRRLAAEYRQALSEYSD
ncbi:nitronate monooxygenase family protein [Microbaculum marinum]|uniref:Nitronate monooxygenase family protein n=1 Tax=Microbaculum marinum TaxID=1764581 RepID=A0AAW9RRA4_9HYPH